MEFTGTQLIPQPQDRTWAAITDPEVLKLCIPGCDSMTKVSDAQYDLVMTAKVGPVSAKFKGKITLADVTPPDAYRLVFEGQGGVAGFAKGEAQVGLAPEGAGTRLSYSAQATIGGKLAQVGQRLVDGVAKKTAAAFFERFNAHLSKNA